MPIAFPLLLVLASTAAGNGSAFARDPDADWFKLVSPHFELYSDTRPSEATRVLRELETFHHVVSRFLGVDEVVRRPAKVFFFNDDTEFAPFKPLYAGKPRPVRGFHAHDPLDHVLALSRQSRNSATMRILFHEYTHLLTSRTFRLAPIWANEGIAEVFSTFETDGNRYTIGVALTNHVLFLQKNGPTPVLDLLSVGKDSPDYNEERRAGRFYASAWLLTHYLLFGRGGFQTNIMARYADACSRTTNQTSAFIAALGSPPPAFDAPLATYLQGGRYTVVRQTYPYLQDVRPKRIPLRRGELDFVQGRLLQVTGHSETAKRRLDRARAAAPRDSGPVEALALLAWREGDRDTWRRLVDEAVQLGSRHGFVFYLASEARYESLAMRSVPEVARERAWAEGRRLCEDALRLDPTLAPAHHLLGVYILSANPRIPALAMPHIEEALRCDPHYAPALLTLASLLALEGKLTQARGVLSAMLAGPLSSAIRAQAKEVADQVDRRLKR